MEKQFIPKLRFPEFNNKYSKYEFSDIVKRGKKSYNPSKDPENLPCIELESLTQGTGQLIKTFDSKSLKSNKTRFSKNEVLFGKLRPYLKKFLLTNFEGVCTSEILVFQGKLTSNEYLFYLIQTEKFNYESNVSSGSKMPRTDWDYLSGIKFSIPTLSEEQQKIASFLTAVDTKINQLTKKKELLEQYKKGVMQKIFSQEIRFKDDNGNDFPEWEEKRLSKITKYYDGTHQTPNYVSEGIPFYSVEHVTANQFEKTKYISEEVFDKENKRVKLEKGDILMTRIGNVGKAKYIDWNVKASFYVSLALIKQGSSFSSKYLAQYINAEPFQRELWKRIIHVAFPIKINLGEIGNCIVKLPCREEQTKISNFLSAVDDKIEALTTQIEKTTTFKKGLLQQMFV
ncbi:restriction endonuclease subunit S [Leeuwenhoekiella sp. NPDC079379]|uniref:restriction endonuclease subunit S n=1 Tax=Leeuwenhoekiella sp. NPDC079379 TaxID=3364122 RepID=UPI0037C7F647